jgi:hypothetical protein
MWQYINWNVTLAVQGNFRKVASWFHTSFADAQRCQSSDDVLKIPG